MNGGAKMKGNKIILISLMCFSLLIVFFGSVSVAVSVTRVVYLPGESPCTISEPDEPQYYHTTIQSAVDAGGDIIKVCPGTYYENVWVHKGAWACHITIESYSQDPLDTIVHAADPNKDTFNLGCMTWDNIASPSISGFTITGATGDCSNFYPYDGQPCAGIRIYCTHYGMGGIIGNNYITGNNIGLNIKDSDPTWEFFYTVLDNYIFSNDSVGIKRYYGLGNTFGNNYISDNPIGIIAYDGDSFIDNTIISNGVGIEGNDLFYHNNIIGNTIQAPDLCSAYNSYLLEGNYWSDYTGDDDGSGTGKHAVADDNIGDTLIPHPSDTCSGNSDEYPFMFSDAWLCSNLPVMNASTSFYTLQEAYDAALNGDTIQSRSIILPKDLNCNRNISITLNGGYDCSYSTNAEITTIYGKVMISDGSVTIQSGTIEIL